MANGNEYDAPELEPTLAPPGVNLPVATFNTSVSYPRIGPFDEVMATFDFDSFLVGATSMGLPVTVLRRLHDRGWKCAIDSGRATSFTPSNWLQNKVYGEKTIHLSQSQCFPIVGGGQENTISCTSTLYHEFTHAYLFEFEDTLQSLLAVAKTHYVGINLKDGTEASDTGHVLHESAASYVGDSIEAVVRLTMSCRAVAKGMNGVARRPLKDAREGKVIIDIAFRDYTRFLTQEVFGNVDEVQVTKTIDPNLRDYLSTKVLERLRERGAALARALLPNPAP